MVDFEGMFGTNSPNQERFAAEAVTNDVLSLLSELENETKQSSRSYSADDVAEILRHKMEPGTTEDMLVNTIELLAKALEDAQHKQTTIDYEIEQRLLSGIHPSVKLILEQLRQESQAFAWIKLSSV